MSDAPLLTLAVDIPSRADHSPAGTDHSPAGLVRAIGEDDAAELGSLYLRSHPSGVADDLDGALADIRATFAGTYGTAVPWGCLAAVAGDRLVAAVLTVHRAPWPDTPDGPFVVELFTDPAMRRQGLATDLLHRVLAAAAHHGEHVVGLRVGVGNHAARSLYTDVGFRPFPRPPAPESRWTTMDDPAVAPVLAELHEEYVGLYGPGAQAEMTRYPTADFGAPDGGVLVLADTRGLAATAAFRRWDADTAEFKRMWVRADVRRRGLARRVLTELEQEVRRRGYRRVRLTTGSAQSGAARLYAAAGYTHHFPAELLDHPPAEFRELLFTRPL